MVRKQIQNIIAQAIQGARKGTELDVHNWTQIATDSVIGLLVDALPPEVNLKEKYELGENGKLPITLSEPLHPADHEAVNYIGKFAEDNGWNHYRYTAIQEITNEYLQNKTKFASIDSGDNK